MLVCPASPPAASHRGGVHHCQLALPRDARPCVHDFAEQESEAEGEEEDDDEDDIEEAEDGSDEDEEEDGTPHPPWLRSVCDCDRSAPAASDHPGVATAHTCLASGDRMPSFPDSQPEPQRTGKFVPKRRRFGD